MKRLFLCLALLMAAQPALAAADFSDWAVLIVAGDDHAHSGKRSDVFDNARRDLGNAFAGIGFAPANIRELSVQPKKFPKEELGKSSGEAISQDFWNLTQQAKGGCLVYFTSHGSPDGVLVNDRLLPPEAMAALVDNDCGTRPTVVIVSACYSGVFVPALAADNRMVLTAARPDRSSFGCGEEDHYTFFDTCILAEIGKSGSFPELADRARTCVAQRETEMDMAPASEPQLSIGSKISGMLSWR